MSHDYSRPDTGSLPHIKGGGILGLNQETKTTQGSASHLRNSSLRETLQVIKGKSQKWRTSVRQKTLQEY